MRKHSKSLTIGSEFWKISKVPKCPRGDIKVSDHLCNVNIKSHYFGTLCTFYGRTCTTFSNKMLQQKY